MKIQTYEKQFPIGPSDNAFVQFGESANILKYLPIKLWYTHNGPLIFFKVARGHPKQLFLWSTS